ncbi:Peroxidase 2 [Hordeum vulgare]|nr:Peroxidase 2 [Hordeum vulgare]
MTMVKSLEVSELPVRSAKFVSRKQWVVAGAVDMEFGFSRSKFYARWTSEGCVKCIDYFTGGDRLYLITGSDDSTAKVWDYQTKSCVQTLEGHTHNISGIMSCRPLHRHPPQKLASSPIATSRQVEVVVMASSSLSVVLLLCLAAAASAQISPTFYDASCPGALATIKSGVAAAGCDASVLLAGNERNAFGNVGSLRGFDVIEKIKSDVERACKRVVSCADILAVAARDSVVAVGGPSWTVSLGRRDSDTASETLANRDLPPPSLGVADLNTRFAAKGLNLTDMVALSGAHTIGRAQCRNFRSRLYNEANIDPDFATARMATCPQPLGSGDGNLAPLDATTPDTFNNDYFVNLKLNKGLLHSDQVLYAVAGGATEEIIDGFASNPDAFSNAFAAAMVKMGNISPLIFPQGLIRRTCSKTT